MRDYIFLNSYRKEIFIFSASESGPCFGPADLTTLIPIVDIEHEPPVAVRCVATKSSVCAHSRVESFKLRKVYSTVAIPVRLLEYLLGCFLVVRRRHISSNWYSVSTILLFLLTLDLLSLSILLCYFLSPQFGRPLTLLLSTPSHVLLLQFLFLLLFLCFFTSIWLELEVVPCFTPRDCAVLITVIQSEHWLPCGLLSAIIRVHLSGRPYLHI